jgi:hypothetical protein
VISLADILRAGSWLGLVREWRSTGRQEGEGERAEVKVVTRGIEAKRMGRDVLELKQG